MRYVFTPHVALTVSSNISTSDTQRNSYAPHFTCTFGHRHAPVNDVHAAGFSIQSWFLFAPQRPAQCDVRCGAVGTHESNALQTRDNSTKRQRRPAAPRFCEISPPPPLPHCAPILHCTHSKRGALKRVRVLKCVHSFSPNGSRNIPAQRSSPRSPSAASAARSTGTATTMLRSACCPRQRKYARGEWRSVRLRARRSPVECVMCAALAAAVARVRRADECTHCTYHPGAAGPRALLALWARWAVRAATTKSAPALQGPRDVVVAVNIVDSTSSALL